MLMIVIEEDIWFHILAFTDWRPYYSQQKIGWKRASRDGDRDGVANRRRTTFTRANLVASASLNVKHKELGRCGGASAYGAPRQGVHGETGQGQARFVTQLVGPVQGGVHVLHMVELGRCGTHVVPHGDAVKKAKENAK